jgi:hypothetical protein
LFIYAEDHSYSINWEAEKQYWYDIIYDISKDRNNQAKQVLMVDFTGRAETFVVPALATAQQVADLWKRLLEVPEDIGVQVTSGNDGVYFWGYIASKEAAPFAFVAPNVRSDVKIFRGTAPFEADQIGRLLEIKFRPCPNAILSHEEGKDR